MVDEEIITVRNELSELERVGAALERFGEQHGLPTRAVFELTLALDELLTNVISYAYDDGAEHGIVVRLRRPPGEVVIELEDDGRAFNPLDVAPPDFDLAMEDRPIGGLGVHIVRRVSDDLAYERTNGKNRLTLRKTVPAAV